MLVAGLVAVLLICGWAVFFRVDKNLGLYVQENRLELDSVAVGEERSFSVIVGNDSNQICRVSAVRTSCGCLVNFPEQFEVQPKSFVKVEGKFASGEFGLDSTSKNFVVFELQEPSEKLAVAIHAHQKTAFILSAQSLEVGLENSDASLVVKRNFLSPVKFMQVACTKIPKGLKVMKSRVTEDEITFTFEVVNGWDLYFPRDVEFSVVNEADVDEKHSISVRLADVASFIDPPVYFAVIDKSRLRQSTNLVFEIRKSAKGKFPILTGARCAHGELDFKFNQHGEETVELWIEKLNTTDERKYLNTELLVEFETDSGKCEQTIPVSVFFN
jgi:hypothetical protein